MLLSVNLDNVDTTTVVSNLFIIIIVSAIIIKAIFSLCEKLNKNYYLNNGHLYPGILKSVVKKLLKDEDLLKVISKIYNSEDIDFSKYNTLLDFINDQTKKLEELLYNSIQNNKNIAPVIKKFITRDNINDIVELFMVYYGFDIDLLEMSYNLAKAKENINKEEKTTVDEQEDENKNNDIVVEKFYEDSNMNKKYIKTIEQQNQTQYLDNIDKTDTLKPEEIKDKQENTNKKSKRIKKSTSIEKQKKNKKKK